MSPPGWGNRIQWINIRYSHFQRSRGSDWEWWKKSVRNAVSMIFPSLFIRDSWPLQKVNTGCFSILFCLFPQPGGGINTIELHEIRYLLLWFHRYSKKRLSISTLYINCSLGKPRKGTADIVVVETWGITLPIQNLRQHAVVIIHDWDYFHQFYWACNRWNGAAF